MRDSSVYQGILEEGRAEGQLTTLRQVLRRQGEKRFGVPPPEVEAQLNQVHDTRRLERMTDRILTAADWHDLLSTP